MVLGTFICVAEWLARAATGKRCGPIPPLHAGPTHAPAIVCPFPNWRFLSLVRPVLDLLPSHPPALPTQCHPPPLCGCCNAGSLPGPSCARHTWTAYRRPARIMLFVVSFAWSPFFSGGDGPAAQAPVAPKVVLMFSGKRKSGKDFITDLLLDRSVACRRSFPPVSLTLALSLSRPRPPSRSAPGSASSTPTSAPTPLLT